MRRSTAQRTAAALLCCGAVLVAALQASAEATNSNWRLQEAVETAVEWIHQQGELAPAFYTLFLAVWIACLLPCSVVEILPGFLFGFKTGFGVALCGKVMGAVLSLCLCRALFAERIKSTLLTSPRAKALSRAIEQEGLGVMVVVRLSYMPMVFKNYGMAVLEIPAWKFVVSAVIAGTPFSALWAFLGASSQDLQSIMSGNRRLVDLVPTNPWEQAALAGSLVLVVMFAVVVLNKVRVRMAMTLAELEPEESEKANQPKWGGTWRLLAGVAAVGAAGAAYWTHRENLPSLKEVMLGAVGWIHEQGDMGPVYYVVFLAAWVAALLPCSILEMVPGYLFGFRRGVVVSIIGKNLGTIASLLIGRYLLRGLMQKRLLARYPKLRALEKAVKAEGFPVLIMIRCAYLPMLVKNYGLSCLDVSIFQVWLASLFASFPFASLWTMIGASATNLGDIFEGRLSARDMLPDNVMLVGAAATVLGASFLYAFGSFMRRFREILAEAEADEQSKKER